MLLKGTIKDLERYSQRMDHANSPHLRRVLSLHEKWSRILEQIAFLKRCRDADIFPNSIEYLKRPTFLGKINLSFKRSAIRKLIRFIYKDMWKSRQDCEEAILEIFSSKETGAATSMSSICERAFQRSKSYHAERLRKKFEHLCHKQGAQPAYSTQTVSQELVTDLSGALQQEELDLLAKGPKFAISKEWSEETKLDMEANLCKLAYQLRWRHILSDRTTALPRYPESSRVHPPNNEDPDLEAKLRRCFAEVRKITENMDSMRMKPNISRNEQIVLKNLQRKDLVFLPSDKGGEFCVIEAKKYDEIAVKHLSDTKIYQQVPRMTAKTVENKVNTSWKQVCSEASIPSHLKMNFTSNNTDLPKFYHLIKTHKEGNEVKCRPIVSNHDGPTTKISWLLNKVLEPLYEQIPAHIPSSSQLMECITNLDCDFNTYRYPFSIDVCAMYTSIPIDDAIEAIKHKIEYTNKHLPLSTRHICDLLRVVLENGFFEYRGRIYRQASGLPIGNCVSGILSSVFMDSIEQQALHQTNFVLYKRYVDDGLIITTSEEEAKVILDKMNCQNQAISFDIELPNQGSLSLLDFQLKIDGGVSFSFYKKNAKKDIFVNFNSAIPTVSKIHCIRNEIHRINEKCTLQADKEKHVSDFLTILSKNGYPDPVIRQAVEPRRKRKKKTARADDYVYLKLPFISDRFFYKIQRIFQKADLPVRVYDRSTTLRQALSRKPFRKECSMQRCGIRGSGICFTKKCVYKIMCTGCDSFYVGSTLRYFHSRFKEHMEQQTSSVFQHKRICNATFSAKILRVARDNTTLRFLEALLIAKLCPSINNKQESEEFRHLLF